MTDNELDQLMQRVLLDAIKSDCEKENSVVPSFEPSLRYQRSLAAMIADPLKWAHKRTKPLWKKVLQKVAIVLIVFSLSLGRASARLVTFFHFKALDPRDQNGVGLFLGATELGKF